MARFRQAAPDPEKAARDGVASYIPSRRQPNLEHECSDCDRTATWRLEVDGEELYACHTHRQEHVFTTGTYREQRL